MKKIEVYSNWCYFDQLDGKVLKDGEILKIQWPDGFIMLRTAVKLQKYSEESSDHGHAIRIPHKEACVKVLYHGAHVLIRLLDAGVLAERVP